ncbi:MAG: hypothetical protein CME64_05515 [Halobacteriovoraceae bacterium]|nr:hypothetical protein [Halobacteriovoraceae bacterium]|tara:strand:+ start:239094 stop:240101 length:1008 start_codon:yes stop_codon:yes gene_type:complete
MKSKIIPALIIGLSFSLLSCNKKEEHDSGIPNNGYNAVTQGDKSCNSLKAVYVFDGGDVAISQTSENSWVSWHIDSGEVQARGFALDTLKMGPGGEYAVTKSSKGNYLLKLSNGVYKLHRRLGLTSKNTLDVEFSEDSKYLIIKSKAFWPRGSFNIDVLDIEANAFLSTFNRANVKFVKIHDGHIYFGQEKSWNKSISKFELISQEKVFTIELPYYTSFDSMDLSSSMVIVDSGNNFSFYSTEDGSEVFDRNLKYLYQMDSSKKVGLFAKSWTEFSIVDLKNGNELYFSETPRNLIISSCRIKTNPLKLVCRDSFEQDKIVIWDLESGENSLACY